MRRRLPRHGARGAWAARHAGGGPRGLRQRPATGVDVTALVAAAKGYGLAVKPLAREPETLAELPLPGDPALAPSNHFVVLEKVTRRGFVLLDPAVGRRIVDRAEMGRSFTGLALALAPGETFETGGARPSLPAMLARHARGSADGLWIVLACGVLGLVPAIALAGAVQVFTDHVVGEKRVAWTAFVLAALLLAALRAGRGGLRRAARLDGDEPEGQDRRRRGGAGLPADARASAGLLRAARCGASSSRGCASARRSAGRWRVRWTNYERPTSSRSWAWLALVALHGQSRIGLVLRRRRGADVPRGPARAPRGGSPRRQPRRTCSMPAPAAVGTARLRPFEAFRPDRAQGSLRTALDGSAEEEAARRRASKLQDRGCASALAALGHQPRTPLLASRNQIVLSRPARHRRHWPEEMSPRARCSRSRSPSPGLVARGRSPAIAQDLCEPSRRPPGRAVAARRHRGAMRNGAARAPEPEPHRTAPPPGSSHSPRSAPASRLAGTRLRPTGPNEKAGLRKGLRTLAPQSPTCLSWPPSGRRARASRRLARIRGGARRAERGVRPPSPARRSRDWPRAERTRRLAYVPQTSAVFSGTLAENVALFDPAIDDDAVVRALEIAGAEHLVARARRPACASLRRGASAQRRRGRSAWRWPARWCAAPTYSSYDETTSALDPLREGAVARGAARDRRRESCA